MTDDLISVNELKFSRVVTPGHKEIGVIDDVVIHQNSERVAYVVLKMRGFMGFGDKRFPIPLGAFYLDTKEDRKVILDADIEKLKNAPAIEVEELPVYDYTAFMWKVYEYYGVKPYLNDDKGNSDIKLSNTMRSRPATIRNNRLKNNPFDNHHKSVTDRHRTHHGF